MDASVSAKTTASTFETDVRAIVTAKYVRTAGANDIVAGVQPGFVVEPGSEQELAKVLKLTNAAGLAVIPRGGGTKLEWGNWPARATVGGVLSTNDSGALRLRFGSLRDLVIGVTLALADGTLASSGGRV